MEFQSEDARNNFLKKAGGDTIQVGGISVKIKRALSKINASRNYSLRRADELLKADARASGQEVKAFWTGQRRVEVGGVVAFAQDNTELTGRFAPPFDNIIL